MCSCVGMVCNFNPLYVQKLDIDAAQTVFLKSLDNYIMWCNYLRIQPVWSKYRSSSFMLYLVVVIVDIIVRRPLFIAAPAGVLVYCLFHDIVSGCRRISIVFLDYHALEILIAIVLFLLQFGGCCQGKEVAIPKFIFSDMGWGGQY